MSAHHRSLLEAFRKVSTIAGRLSFDANVVNRTNEFYKKAVESKEWGKNRKSEALLVACLYIACKREDVSCGLKELCAVSGVQKRDLSRAYSRLKKLGLFSLGKKKTSDVVKMIEQYCTRLGLPYAITKAAEQIADNVSKSSRLDGKHPQSVAGAVILLASQFAPAHAITSFGVLADVTQKSETTLRQAYNQIYQFRKEYTKGTSFGTSDEILNALPKF